MQCGHEFLLSYGKTLVAKSLANKNCKLKHSINSQFDFNTPHFKHNGFIITHGMALTQYSGEPYVTGDHLFANKWQ